MEQQLNRIELRGNVGTVYLNETGENRMIRFSLATNYMYKGRDGNAVIDTTWHNIIAWEGRGMPDFSKITKGRQVYVQGRVRTSRYTSAEGVEKQSYEVVASRLVPEDGAESRTGGGER